MSRSNVLIIDGFSVMFRAFYSFPASLTLADQTPINAVFGFLTLVLKAIDQFSPTHFCICFDHKDPTFRKQIFSDYKANRPPPPDEFKVQVPLLQNMLAELGFYYIDLPGYEADDLMGTLSVQCGLLGSHVYLLTSDQDCFQLVNEQVSVTMSQKGVADLVVYTPQKVFEKLHIKPETVVDYKALRGDVSDNIPGVKGIGEKTAVSLLSKYENLDRVYDHLNDISSESVVRKLRTDKANAYLSRQLATIVCDLNLSIDQDRLQYQPDWLHIISVFKKYQFTNLIKKYTHKISGHSTVQDSLSGLNQIPKSSFVLLSSIAELKAILSDLKLGFALDLETTSLSAVSAQIVGISLSFGDQAYYIALNAYLTAETGLDHSLSLFPTQPSAVLFQLNPILKLLKPILEDPTVPKITHHGKYETVVLANYGIKFVGITFDTMLAAYLLFPGEKVGLKMLVYRHLNVEMMSYESVVGQGKSALNFRDVPVETAKDYAAADAFYTWQLYQFFLPLIEDKKLMSLLVDIELPTQLALADMESTGVCLDQRYLVQLESTLKAQHLSITNQIYELCAQPFNLSSPKQLATILYDELKLPVLKKTKTGRSTDSSVLEKLAKDYPIATLLLFHRRLEKLLTTYVSVLPQLIVPRTGRIHTQFNQTVAITGRLSSSSPNLQNIPIRTEEGKQIRKAFIPSTGDHCILAIDYSQIELRLMAHLSADPAMINAFKRGDDIHQATAAIINDVPLESVTKEMRYHAKAVNFGIIYGISAFGLAENLGIDRHDAQTIIDQYFDQFPCIKTFMEATIALAKEEGVVKTEYGRIRPVPGINDRLFNRRSFAERAAINTRVQGTAADIMKLAMVKVFQALKTAGFMTQLLIQVHDELVFDVPKSELGRVVPVLKQAMTTVSELTVPLEVDIEVGPNWLDLTPYQEC